MGYTILMSYGRRVPLPTVPSTIARRTAPYVLTFLQGTTQQGIVYRLVNNTYQIISKLWLYITEFDLPPILLDTVRDGCICR